MSPWDQEFHLCKLEYLCHKDATYQISMRSDLWFMRFSKIPKISSDVASFWALKLVEINPVVLRLFKVKLYGQVS